MLKQLFKFVKYDINDIDLDRHSIHSHSRLNLKKWAFNQCFFVSKL